MCAAVCTHAPGVGVSGRVCALRGLKNRQGSTCRVVERVQEVPPVRTRDEQTIACKIQSRRTHQASCHFSLKAGLTVVANVLLVCQKAVTAGGRQCSTPTLCLDRQVNDTKRRRCCWLRRPPRLRPRCRSARKVQKLHAGLVRGLRPAAARRRCARVIRCARRTRHEGSGRLPEVSEVPVLDHRIRSAWE